MNLRPYAQLVRLPNLPSAWADVTMAALVTGKLVERFPVFLLLLLASTALYWAGMVLNDYFDVEQDRRERPSRPLPSGAISERQAWFLGTGLLLGGVALASLAGVLLYVREQSSGWARPGVLALLLAVMVLAYDGWLKRTPMGPVAMGTCRFFNVLLGVSISGGSAGLVGPHLALVVGLYVVGLTWLARTEARQSHRGSLFGAACVILGSLALALPLPVIEPGGATSPLFPYLLVGLAFLVGLPISEAVRDPSPTRVQNAVKRCLVCLIVLDAILTSSRAGTLGLVVLVLMAPSLYLNRQRWLYAT